MITLCDDSTCTGCGLCKEVCKVDAITIVKIPEGSKKPVIDAMRCVDCGRCVRYCPQMNDTVKNHPLKVYASWHTDVGMRRKSSSGGAFSAIAEGVIRNGGVIYGAVLTENATVKHCRAENMEELSSMRGSKYVQSDIQSVYADIRHDIKCGRIVLFTGTPCQVAAVKNLMGDAQNLYTIDLVCHGVPPERIFHAYPKSVSVNPTDVTQFTFRWTPGRSYCLALDGMELPLRKQYYIKAFAKGYILNNACYQCKYADIHRTGDITIGDFWGLGKLTPFKYSQRSGISLLLQNTEKAKNLLSLATNLCLKERSIEEARLGNRGLNKPCERSAERDTFIADLLSGLPYELLCAKYKIGLPCVRDYLQQFKRYILNRLIHSQ